MNVSGESELPISDALLRFANGVRRLVQMSLARLLYALGFTANATTWTGAVIFVSGCVVWPKHHWIGLIMVFIGAWFDVADGAVTKLVGYRTAYGGILDSSMDRIMDGMVFYALYSVMNTGWEQTNCLIAALGAFLVSYSRGKAEAAGVRGNVGIGAREVRLPLIGVGGLVGMITGWHLAWTITVAIVSVMSWSTFVYRLYFTKKELIRLGKNKLPL